MSDSEIRVSKYKAWLKAVLESSKTVSNEFLLYQRTETGYSIGSSTVKKLLKEMEAYGVLEIKDGYVESKIYKN